MSRPTIDYLNARRAAKAAAGGTNYAVESDSEREQRIADELAHDNQLDEFDTALNKARSAISDFALWAEASRCQYLNVINIGHQTLSPYQTGDDSEEWK